MTTEEKIQEAKIDNALFRILADCLFRKLEVKKVNDRAKNKV